MSSSFRKIAAVAFALPVVLFCQGVQPPAGQDQADQQPTIRVGVDLVNIYYTVKAKKGGQLIPNLEKSDFTVFEDGKQQNVEHFSRETDLPLTLGLLIDISASHSV